MTDFGLFDLNIKCQFWALKLVKMAIFANDQTLSLEHPVSLELKIEPLQYHIVPKLKNLTLFKGRITFGVL